MIRAYLFALDPTDAQVGQFRSHCGAQRVAYNWVLARVRANWEQRAAEQTYGLTGDQLTPWVDTCAYGLRMAWNAVKREVAPWWRRTRRKHTRLGARTSPPRWATARRAGPGCPGSTRSAAAA